MLLSYAQLSTLHQALRGSRVLSVYIDGTNTDPAHRFAWRQALRDAIDEVAAVVAGASKAEREGFARCLAALDKELEPIEAAIKSPGWVAFVTEDGVQHAGPVPAAVPTVVQWQEGIWAAPYARVLRQNRPVISMVIDGERASLYRYCGGTLAHLKTLHAHVHGGHADHLGNPAQPGFHTGTRGATATELSQAARLSARDKLVDEALRQVFALSGRESGVLIGGAPEVVHAAAAMFEVCFPGRVLVCEGLHGHATEAEIAVETERGAEQLLARHDVQAVNRLLELAGARGRGVLGIEGTLVALSMHEGREVLLTPDFLVREATVAEEIVDLALEQHAALTIVSGEAATGLDAVGGIGAILRFVIPSVAGAPPEPTSVTPSG